MSSLFLLNEYYDDDAYYTEHMQPETATIGTQQAQRLLHLDLQQVEIRPTGRRQSVRRSLTYRSLGRAGDFKQ